MNKEKRDSFPSKKDMCYWLVIAVLAIVVVSVWRVDSPDKLVGQLSLGAALLSMLLAVVGIIIPFIQGNETSRQNFRLLEHISALTTQVALYRELSEKVEQAANKMAEDLKQKHESTQVKQTPEGLLIWQERQSEINNIKRGISDLSTRINVVGKDNQSV